MGFRDFVRFSQGRLAKFGSWSIKIDDEEEELSTVHLGYFEFQCAGLGDEPNGLL